MRIFLQKSIGMANMIRVFGLFALLLCTAESLQIRKTVKLDGERGSESVGHKQEIDGEREEVYDFFDQRYGQDEDDVRKEDFSEGEDIDLDSSGAEEHSDSETAMKLPTLKLEPANLAHGTMVERRAPWDGETYGNIFRQGLSTSTPAAGAEVRLTRDDLSSEAEGNVKLFLSQQISNGTCAPVDATKVVNAYCGNHYLFPGYSLKLVSSEHCSWRFRHLSPEILFAMNGMQLEKDLIFKVEERLVTSRPKTFSVKVIATDEAPRKLVPTLKLLRELVVTTPKVKEPGNVNAEICAASGPGSTASEYEGFQTTCCSRSDACGLPDVDNIIGHKLTMQALPWEALLTIRGTPTSDSAETWCAGALISSEWVLTTASCFIRNGLLTEGGVGYVPEVIVAFGLKNTTHHVDAIPAPSDNIDTHAIDEIHVFPTATETHDIALVRLKQPSSRMPVCLPAYTPPNPARSLYNKPAVVFGWVVDDGGPYLGALRQKVISSDKCTAHLGKRLPPHMICSVDTRGDEPCLADGDLLTVVNNRYFLSGLTWPRLKCSDSYRPHTSVAYFMNWIASVTGMAMPRPAMT